LIFQVGKTCRANMVNNPLLPPSPASAKQLSRCRTTIS
jgi:hypothetical protein